MPASDAAASIRAPQTQDASATTAADAPSMAVVAPLGVPEPSTAHASAAALPVWGQAMSEFLMTALAEDPSIERARADIAAAESNVSAAKWQFGPTPSFSREPAGMGYSSGAYVNVLRVTQPLYTGGALTAGLSAAKTSLRSSHQELLAAQLQLKQRIVATWAEWAKARGRVDNLQLLETSHQQLLDMIERRTRAGVSTASDAALATSRLSAVRAELAQARLDETLQREQLQRLARRPVTDTLLQALAGDLPAAPALNEVLQGIQNAPEMMMARAGVDIAQDELTRAKAGLKPTVSLRYDHQSGARSDQRIGVVVQASMNGGFASIAALGGSRARIQAAQAAVAATEQDLFNRYQLDFTRYQAATASASNAVATSAASDDVLRSYRRQFDAGRRAWLDLLNMVREAHAARQSEREARIDQRAGLFRLRLLIDQNGGT
ncbi:TolC family protein [Roseateles amylovorans]|uniref:TolC family protein n=1 Tax=Roseateles amylovorans TaxID=2978473 RepID=A0ABY6ATT9_9BURK|nr:TolC family protein [Roseateles amylovorans]UXH76252.1 TolC family protein [Roseateles amylovorans]